MDKPNRGVSLFLTIGPFPAVIAFQILANPGRRPGTLLVLAAIMLAYCLLVLAVSRGRGGPGYFDYALTAYSALIVCALLVSPTLGRGRSWDHTPPPDCFWPCLRPPFSRLS